MAEPKTKLLLKLINEKTGRAEWQHICYIPSSTYNLYMATNDYSTSDLNECFHRWVQEDFKIDIAFYKSSDILILKTIVKDFYKTVYPLLFLDCDTDRQGWLRIWVTKKMKEDLGQYGEECI